MATLRNNNNNGLPFGGGRLSSFFFVDYTKWPTFIRHFVTTKHNRVLPPFIMPLLALIELLIFTYNTVDINNGCLDFTWKINAGWARLNIHKPYEGWRWITFGIFNGTALQFALKFIMHATFGVILEIFNGTLALVLVHVGYLAIAWLACLYLIAEKIFLKIPVQSLENDFESRSADLQILVWLGLYTLIMANFWFCNRRFMSSYICRPLLIFGALYILTAIFYLFSDRIYGPASVIILWSFTGSFILSNFVASFFLPRGKGASIRKNCTILYLTFFGYVLFLVIFATNVSKAPLPKIQIKYYG